MWTSFETQDGRSIEGWLVTDEADTPGGTDARRGQWVMREVKLDPETNTPVISTYVLDQPESSWTVTAVAPEGTPANSPIQMPVDPAADLWGMNADQLSTLAAELGVEYNPALYPGRPPKYNLIKQIDAKRRGAIALLETRPEPLQIRTSPIEPHPGPPSLVEIDPGSYEG